MNLRWKLLLSYLGVVAIALIVLAAATAAVAPAAFSGGMGMMRRGQEGGNRAPGQGMGMMGTGRGASDETVTRIVADLNEEINANFRQAVYGALLLAGGAAIIAAAGVSWWISRRIVQPISRLSAASGHIAAGHYESRLPVETGDELGELTHSFNRMAEALAQTEAARQQLIGDVSHELKTPLASIKGYMEGLEDGIIPAAPETYQLIHGEADRLQRLVRDLEELSRAEADQLNLHIVPQDAGAIASSAAEWIRPQFDERGVALTVLPLAPPVQVQADFDRTRQVLLNLLGNALQYTPAGGQVTLHLARMADAVRFTVADSGIGLAPEDLERIFQRFYRVDKSRSRASGGSGVGLTIARHIIEAQGGTLWATSDGPGLGSSFTFTLPLA